MPDPVFAEADRVANNGSDDLEASLVGKSPKEIAAIIREREQRARAEAARVEPPPRNEPPPPSQAEFWNDPNRSTERVIAAKALTREEYDRVSASVRPTLRWAAKNIVREKHADWARLDADVEAIMAKVPEHLHTDPVMWETCYWQARGQAHDRLALEDRNPQPTSERVVPPGTPPPPEEDLTKVTLPGITNKYPKTAATVCENLGVTHDSYRKSRKILDGDGLLPLTVDNRRTR
jgi:hypothetical protein